MSAADDSSYPLRTCQICSTLSSIVSCLSFSSSGVICSGFSGELPPVMTVPADPAPPWVGVISSEMADDTAELAGVLKFLLARRTFQNCR